MALKDVGYFSVAASQYGTAVGVYAVPNYAVPASTSDENPFYATRHDVAAQRRPLDLAEFIETAVPLNNSIEDSAADPKRERRIVIMKKRG